MLVPTFKSSALSTARKRILILGSTGSIGNSALNVIEAHPEKFEIFGLVAGKNAQALSAQIDKYRPRYAALADGRLNKVSGPTEFISGQRAILELCADPDVDLVLAAVVGMSGLESTLAAAKAGKRIALANKESLVCAGKLFKEIQSRNNFELIPVDSEHSAIFQALQAEDAKSIDQIILTASGGPFLDRDQSEFSKITPAEALKHPRWKMGPKISIDSASLMNKALELIEAYWLFGIEAEKIEVLVHPQSIVHSLVSFVDGSQIAQLSLTDMRGAIAYALNYPQVRMPNVLKRLNLAELRELTFRALDPQKFRAISLARQALNSSSAMSAVLNISNEIAVESFLSGRISFDKIVETVEQALARFAGRSYNSFEELMELEKEVRLWA